MGCPSIKDFKNMIEQNMIMNCTVSVTDVENSIKVYGPDILTLKGKTSRSKSVVVQTDEIVVPRQLLDNICNITLAVDILFVNNQPFFVSISRGLKFATVEHRSSRNKKNFLELMYHVMYI